MSFYNTSKRVIHPVEVGANRQMPFLRIMRDQQNSFVIDGILLEPTWRITENKLKGLSIGYRLYSIRAGFNWILLMLHAYAT